MSASSGKPYYQRLMDSTNDFFHAAFNPEYISEIDEFEKAQLDDRVTIIGPVRFALPHEKEQVNNHLEDLKKKKKVYEPSRHTLQTDPKQGLTICNSMNYALFMAPVHHVLMTQSTKGSWFDEGISIFYKALNVPIKTPDWEDDLSVAFLANCNKAKPNELYNTFIKFKSYVINQNDLGLELRYDDFKSIKREDLVKFGMIFAALKKNDEKTFKIINRKEVEENSLKEDMLEDPILKSYSKVALRLDDLCKNKRHI